MNVRIFGVGIAALALSVGLGITIGTARAQEGGGASGQSADKPLAGKVAPWKAIEIAKTKVQGRALNADFEFDEGHWVYGVMIVHDHKISEVEIDPATGKIGDVEEVTPDGEAKEVQGELTKAIGGK